MAALIKKGAVKGRLKDSTVHHIIYLKNNGHEKELSKVRNIRCRNSINSENIRVPDGI